VVTVVGGKLTTYRRMAEDAVDVVIRQRGLAAGPGRTRACPLVGAGDTRAAADQGVPARIIRRYGAEAASLSRDPDLLRPISAEIPVTMAELVWGVEHEGALDAADLLDRRTRIGLVPADREIAVPFAERALALMGAVSPWRVRE
jgi:glycerol-3-phosphate dehydrogenase